MAVDFRALQPLEYLLKHVELGVRPDGRELHASRPVVINANSLSNANGSALVRVGGTSCVCGVKAELANPPEQSPQNGYIVCNVELPPNCSSSIAPGPPSQEAQVLSQVVQDSILRSSCCGREQLSIVEGQLCWCLYVDCVCLSADGCVQDACLLAVATALSNTTLPTVDTSSGSPVVLTDDGQPLTITSFPVAVSFALLQQASLLDPTAEEEGLCPGRVTFVLLSDGRLAGVTKTGAMGLSPARLLELCDAACSQARKLVELVSTARTGD